MTIAEIQQLFRAKLSGIYPDGEIKAFIRIFFEELMGYSPVDIIMRANSTIPDFIEEKVTNAIERLILHEPIQHIVGVAHFHGHRFKVTPSTLIPRPETEQLIDIISDRHTNHDLEVLDIGTGSGCIAISLMRCLKFAHVDAFDISEKALEVAKANAEVLNAAVCFHKVDILNAVPSKKYNIIVSNPPYICLKEKSQMESNVLDYEPHTALFVPDDDPLLFYQAITEFAAKSLTAGGWLYFEINPIYATETRTMMEEKGFSSVEIIRDFYGKERFIEACLKKQD